jgi:cytochrome P450
MQSAGSHTVSPEDVSSVAFWSRSFTERDETFRRLRATDPVSWHPPLETPGLSPGAHGEPGFWAVTRAADIAHVSRHPELFSSDEQTHGSLSILMRPVPRGYYERPTFIGMDPPQHTRYRRALSRAFTARAVARVADRIEKRAARIVEEVVGAGEVDFVSAVSARLPMYTVADVLGIPDHQAEAFAVAGDAAVHCWDPAVNGGEDPMDFRARHLAVLREIGVELVERRRREPADDVITALALFDSDGERLDAEDIQQVMNLFSVAGNDTTRHTTTHAVLQLWRHPEQRDWLNAEFDERITGAIAESIRHGSPVIHFARTATQDLDLKGRTVRAGDKVVMFYCSANRDESVFPDPHRFDLSRSPNPHQGFGGGGVHYCLGAGIAAVQLRALIRQILTKLPAMRIGEPEYLWGEFIHGIKHLPVIIP